MNKKVFLWILIAISALAIIWGAISLFNINFLKGAAPNSVDLPKEEEKPRKYLNDVYLGEKIDDKTYQGEVLSSAEDSFTLRIDGEEVTVLFNEESKRQFELLEIEAGNVAFVEFVTENGKAVATYIEKVLSFS